MGADIHFYIEYRQKGEEWQLHPRHVVSSDVAEDVPYYTDVSAAHRYYEFFGILAGVRGDGCIYRPRGFPHNLSKKLKLHTDHYLEHTPHWLTVDEFQKCLMKLDKRRRKELKWQYKQDLQSLANGEITQQEFDYDWKVDPNDKRQKCHDIFFSYDAYPSNYWIHPGYDDIIPYIKNFEEELKAEYILFDEDPPEYEFRFVFYFDS